MKKILSTAAIGIAGILAAQVSVSGRANMLFPSSSPSWKDIKASGQNTYDQKGKNSVGYNLGLSVKVDLPTSFFLMPELYYTTFKNEFTDPTTNTKIEAKSNRVDLPVLIGKNVLGETLGIFVGPVASYNLSADNQYNDFKENAKNDFTLGYQFGAQAKLKQLIINARYEGAFTKDQRDFINKNVMGETYTVKYDNRPGLLILGLGYKF